MTGPQMTRYLSLRERLEELAKEDKRIEAAVILTYEFDPELIESLASSGTINLGDEDESGDGFLWTSDFPCALFYDPKCTQAPARLPGNFEVHFWSKRGPYRCHHSKAYAFVFDDGTAELILGSFNLTASGLSRNRELLLDFLLSKEDRAHEPVFRDWLRFVRQELRKRAPESDALLRYELRLSMFFEREDSEKTFAEGLLASGYAEFAGGLSGLESLRKRAKDTGLKPETLVFVSPFLDHPDSRRPVLSVFLEEKNFPEIKKIVGFTAAKAVPKRLFPVKSEQTLALYSIREEIDEDEEKHLRIRCDRADLALVGLQRNLHAKLLLLLDRKGKGLLYVGSANFTRKAWLSDGNCELGALLLTTGLPDAGVQKIKRSVEALLGVRSDKAVLLDDAVLENDPEEEEGEATFPLNLSSVRLCSAGNEAAATDGAGGHHFEFQTTDERIPAGSFTWEGEKLSLSPANSGERNVWHSQKLDSDKVRRLIGFKRILDWTDGKKAASVPFNVEAEVGVALQFAMEVRAEEVMDFLVSLLKNGRPPRSNKARSDFNRSREEPETTASEEETLVDRNDNLIIRMQKRIAELAELENLLFPREKNKQGGSVTLSPVGLGTDLPRLLKHSSRAFLQESGVGADVRCFLCGEVLKLALRIQSALSDGIGRPQGSTEILREIWEEALKDMKDYFFKACGKMEETHPDAENVLKVLEWYKKDVRAL